MEEQGRHFLKARFNFPSSGQSKGEPSPPIQKASSDDATMINLPEPFGLAKIPLEDALRNRRSRRSYTQKPLTLKELSFLLWATQGIRGEPTEDRAYRSVPSAGCRHAFETYMAVFRVEGLEKGIYRYLPLSNQLAKTAEPEDLENLTVQATLKQKFTGQGAVTFFWSVLPYRMEWRYGDSAYKLIAVDAGHVCQNLYLACEGIGAGTCAILSYEQALADSLISVDGKEEFVVYAASVGKIEQEVTLL